MWNSKLWLNPLAHTYHPFYVLVTGAQGLQFLHMLLPLVSSLSQPPSQPPSPAFLMVVIHVDAGCGVEKDGTGVISILYPGIHQKATILCFLTAALSCPAEQGL